jgi:anti-sigma-K factor RskA
MTETTGRTTQPHEWYQDLLGAYALGALLPDEAAELEAHLATCAECQAELRRLRFGANAYALVAEERSPAPELRDRLWAAISAGPHVVSEPEPVAAPVAPPISIERAHAARRLPAPPLWSRIAAVLAVILIAGLLAWNISLRSEEGGGNGTVIAQLAAAPDAADQATGGEARYLTDKQVLLISLHDLPALPQGEVYQLWLIQGSTVLPSVTFQPGPEATTTVAVAANPDTFDTLAITREPGPIGSAAPTTKPFVTGVVRRD